MSVDINPSSSQRGKKVTWLGSSIVVWAIIFGCCGTFNLTITNFSIMAVVSLVALTAVALLQIVLRFGTTYFDIWPTESLENAGEVCQACYTQGRSGKSYGMPFHGGRRTLWICDKCIQAQNRDRRGTQLIFLTLIGISLIIVLPVVIPEVLSQSTSCGDIGNGQVLCTEYMSDSAAAGLSLILQAAGVLLGAGAVIYGIRIYLGYEKSALDLEIDGQQILKQLERRKKPK